MQTTTTTHARRTSEYTADELAQMTFAQLEGVFRQGTLPAINALDGAPSGRMLTLAGPLGWRPPRRFLAAWARSASFPWQGKTFSSTDASLGRGINRVVLLGDTFPFDTRIEASALDGDPCVLLDYRKPGNPFFIRAIRDELRAVSPDLFLGPVFLEIGNREPRLALWFAIDKT